MQHPKEKSMVLLGLAALGLILSVVAASTDTLAGGADNYAHFNISRWAFRYPHLFLDHWGKPVFTILTAPFAQLGLTAVRIFNITAGLLTAWFCYRLAAHFNLKAAWFAAAVTVFTPIYFIMMPTAMTEVLFSLVLVVSIYLFFKEQYIWSAVIISFLFLVRSEGLAILVFFFTALLIREKYKVIPYLLTGFMLFSLIGWIFYYPDFWWLINKRPYSTGAHNVYGSGEWYYYLKKMPLYYGPVISGILLSGTAVILIRWIRTNFKLTSDIFLLLLLTLGSFWGYLFIHSLLWWLGNTSAGLDRVMAGVSPLIGLMAAFTVNAVAANVNHKKKIFTVLLLLPVFYLGGAATAYYIRLINRNVPDKILKEASQFLNEPKNKKHKLVMHNPYFAWSTSRDAWNYDELQYGFSDKNTPGRNLSDSTLFVWDAHFSPNEGGFSLEQIMKSTDFELIKIFEPETPYIVLGGHEYRILIFRKLSGAKTDNEVILRKLRQEEFEKKIYYSDEHDFEDPFQIEDLEKRRHEKEGTAGGFAFSLEGIEFNPAIHIPAAIVKNGKSSKVKASVDILYSHFLEPGHLFMVFSVEGNDEVYHYVTADFAKQNPDYGVWSKVEFIFAIPEEINEGTVLKTYIWNIRKDKILIDNFKVQIFR